MTRIPLSSQVVSIRSSEHGVDSIFLNRWSPRAMSGQEVTIEELRTLLEAARWAPSSYNEQPWRIVYARRNTEHWGPFLSLLVEGNRAWCVQAGALLVFLARRSFSRNGRPNRTAAFDVGAAWMSLALQGSLLGLVVHGMVGFDFERAAALVGAGSDDEVLAMCAVGRPAPAEVLPEPLRQREFPSPRHPQEAFAFEGRLGR